MVPVENGQSRLERKAAKAEATRIGRLQWVWTLLKRHEPTKAKEYALRYKLPPSEVEKFCAAPNLAAAIAQARENPLAKFAEAPAVVVVPVLVEGPKWDEGSLDAERVQVTLPEEFPTENELQGMRGALNQPEPQPGDYKTGAVAALTDEIAVMLDIGRDGPEPGAWPFITSARIVRKCINKKLVVVQLPDGREAVMLNEKFPMGITVPLRLEKGTGDPLYVYDQGRSPSAG